VLAPQLHDSPFDVLKLPLTFKEWSDVFPNAACVVSLVDRLVHRAEVISIEGESYRLKEARERNEARARQRKTRKPTTKRETA
jgi:hypothetical protein